MRFPERYVASYLRRNSVHGWLHPFSGEVIAKLSLYQVENGIRGSLAEIGVHHGKLFIVLYLTSAEDESAVAIDLFNPGTPPEILLGHAKKLASTTKGIKIIKDSSLNVSAARLLAECGRVRMFSVDGSHMEPDVLSDIALAESVLTEDGVILMDDCFNQGWPEVSAALARHLYGAPRTIPFALTPGKVLMCRPGMTARYTATLEASFARRIDRRARVYGYPVTMLGVGPSDARKRLMKTKAVVALKWLLQRF